MLIQWPVRCGGVGSRTLTGQSEFVRLVGPMLIGGNISIVSGNDYFAADGRAMEWSSNAWPDLTDSEVSFSDGHFTKRLSVIDSGAGISQKIRLELSKEDTNELHGNFQFDVTAVLSNTHVCMLVHASANVIQE